MLAAAVQKKLEKHNIYAASCETRNKLVGTPRRGARYFTVKIYKRFVLGFVRWTQLSSFRAGRRAARSFCPDRRDVLGFAFQLSQCVTQHKQYLEKTSLYVSPQLFSNGIGI